MDTCSQEIKCRTTKVTEVMTGFKIIWKRSQLTRVDRGQTSDAKNVHFQCATLCERNLNHQEKRPIKYSSL